LSTTPQAVPTGVFRRVSGLFEPLFYCQCSSWRRGWSACRPPPRWALLYSGTATEGRHVCARGSLSQRILGTVTGLPTVDSGCGFGGFGGPTVTKAYYPMEQPAVTGGRSRLPAGCSERFAVRPPILRCAPSVYCAGMPAWRFGNEGSADGLCGLLADCYAYRESQGIPPARDAEQLNRRGLAPNWGA
jgi:hypothetical protein